MASAPVKPHAVLFPFPFQGHINPMLKFAKILHHKGFHVTFINTEYNHNRLINSRGRVSLNAVPDFQFHSISDGLPPSFDPDAYKDLKALLISFKKVGLANFRDLISKLNTSSGKENPSVTCLVIDFFCSFCLPVAEELGIQSITFAPLNACGLSAFFHVPGLVERGLLPLKDEALFTVEYMDSSIDWIPGLKKMRVRDLPTHIRAKTVDNMNLRYVMLIIERAVKASAIIINTFDALENETLDATKHLMPPSYTLGPLHLLGNRMSSIELKSLGSNLWKEETDCIKWLDSQEPNSVLFVSFGTTSFLSSDQLNELAWGLANSENHFLWIMRPDLVTEDAGKLSPEFYAATKERSLLVSWCPQEEVLNHSSTGGFLTHSGWNSTVESIAAGVPMICCPSYGDQTATSRYTCAHWGMGIEIDVGVKRDEVEKVVRDLFEGKISNGLRKKGLEWRKKAKEAISPGGSSYINLNKVLNEVLIHKE